MQDVFNDTKFTRTSYDVQGFGSGLGLLKNGIKCDSGEDVGFAEEFEVGCSSSFSVVSSPSRGVISEDNAGAARKSSKSSSPVDFSSACA